MAFFGPRFKRTVSGEIESEKVTIPRKMNAVRGPFSGLIEQDTRVDRPLRLELAGEHPEGHVRRRYTFAFWRDRAPPDRIGAGVPPRHVTGRYCS
jgi:hypothetical protein